MLFFSYLLVAAGTSLIESFRFWDEDEEIFSILSIAHAWTSVILAGKRDSLCHSPTGFSESVVLMETSYKGFIILRPGDGLSSFNKDDSANFLVKKKCNEAFKGVYNLRIRKKTLGQISYS